MQHMAQLQSGHRRGMPPDMAATVANAPSPEASKKTETKERLLDPVTGKLLLCDVPTFAADVLRDAFRLLEEHCTKVAAEKPQASMIAESLRKLPEEASSLASRLQSLMYLFEKAVDHDGRDTPLTEASYLVIETAETIAKQLRALDERAGAIYRPLFDEKYGRKA